MGGYGMPSTSNCPNFLLSATISCSSWHTFALHTNLRLPIGCWKHLTLFGTDNNVKHDEACWKMSLTSLHRVLPWITTPMATHLSRLIALLVTLLKMVCRTFWFELKWAFPWLIWVSVSSMVVGLSWIRHFHD